jgi:hypothetical protein
MSQPPSEIKGAHPNGHFYSPIVNPEELSTRIEQIWPPDPTVVGIDLNDESHRVILADVLPKYLPDYDYPEKLEEHAGLTQFYTQNSQFSWLDSRTLFALLRHWRPSRVLEVGSGFSTLLVSDVNRRFLQGSADVTCIEPYPREFLRKTIPGMTRLIERKVQDVALDEFSSLQSGDILFIDSSHVAKTGSDVNFLYFEVLPRLASGVRIHIHDIFLPCDYPQDWVLNENRSWNEQYLLRAMLTYSSGFRVVFGCSYAFTKFPHAVQTALAHPKGHIFGGGSFWIERA